MSSIVRWLGCGWVALLMGLVAVVQLTFFHRHGWLGSPKGWGGSVKDGAGRDSES